MGTWCYTELERVWNKIKLPGYEPWKHLLIDREREIEREKRKQSIQFNNDEQ